jgi:hypothetical protein
MFAFQLIAKTHIYAFKAPQTAISVDARLPSCLSQKLKSFGNFGLSADDDFDDFRS